MEITSRITFLDIIDIKDIISAIVPPGPHPALLSLAVASHKSWDGAWEQGYTVKKEGLV